MTADNGATVASIPLRGGRVYRIIGRPPPMQSEGFEHAAERLRHETFVEIERVLVWLATVGE
jgi:hypothetical protein